MKFALQRNNACILEGYPLLELKCSTETVDIVEFNFSHKNKALLNWHLPKPSSNMPTQKEYKCLNKKLNAVDPKSSKALNCKFGFCWLYICQSSYFLLIFLLDHPHSKLLAFSFNFDKRLTNSHQTKKELHPKNLK